MISPDGSDPRYPSRWGISMRNNQVLEDRLIRHLDQIGVKIRFYSRNSCP